MVTPQKKPEPVANPDVCVGDHVYFQHKAGPQSAQVKAVGKHGITVHHAEKPHRVRWEHILGHKSRAAQQYSVLEEGEDGMIVTGSDGKRRYLNIPPEARGEKMVLGKSLADGRLAVFVKAGPIKNRPGLHIEQVTDKNGKSSNHWKRSPEAGAAAGYGTHNLQAGDHVSFKNGEHAGSGTIHSVGEHGVVAHDAAGGEHRVLHHQITGHKPAAGAKPTGGILDSVNVDALPVKVNQPFNDWDSLLKGATEGLAQYQDILGKVQADMGLVGGLKPKSLTPEQWADDKGYVFIGSLKGADRAREKVEADYGGDWSQLRDMVRATISVPTMEDVKTVVDKLTAAGIEVAQKPKDRFAKPTSEGYRDLMMIVKLPNGMLAEMQVHLKAMTLAKDAGHKDYEATRSLQGKYQEDQPTEAWSDEDHKKFYEALKAQKKIYSDAWSSASGGDDTKPSDSLTKSGTSGTMIMLLKGGHRGVYRE